MADIDPRDEWRTDQLDELCAAFLTLETADELASFLRDLCTFRELEELSSRWTVVQLLDAGIPYREIAERTGTSTATITRVNQWLQHGTGGYRLARERLEAAAR